MAFTVVSGLVVGLVLGFALQKGGFCMHTAFRSIVFEKDHSVLRSWLLVLVINLVGVNLLYEFRIINIVVAPFFWPAAVLGGLVFGGGMVMAGGCTSGTFYRVGKGMLGSFGALVGFSAGAAAVSAGALRPVMTFLRTPVLDVYGEEPTLSNIFPIDPIVSRWIVIGVLSIFIGFYLLKAPRQKFVTGWGWIKTGLVVGAVGLAAWIASSYSYRDYGMSFTQPTVSLVRLIFNGDSDGVNWSTYMVLGVPVGALIAAVLAKDFSLRLPTPGRFVQQTVGGGLMGIGAAVAGGCNIGHGITGLSALSVTSLVATICTMLGVWFGTWIIFRKLRSPARPEGGK
jgi:uncharacterized membrane protein YedE/YeeE